MARTTKPIGFSVPPSIVLEVERVSRAKGWVAQMIVYAQREDAETSMIREEMLMEDAELLKYGQSRVKKLGIQEKDVGRIMHASRARPRKASAKL